MKLPEGWKSVAAVMAMFMGLLLIPRGSERFENSVMEALYMAGDYAESHVVTCLVPAFFIAGAISVFVRGDAVMKYLGAGGFTAYAVAAVSGSVLAVCSCTVLPLFAGIYGKGAGIGPATAFLYAGPAINVTAVILTARVLGVEMGAARAVGALLFSVVIGLAMSLLFGNEKRKETTSFAGTRGAAGSGGEGGVAAVLFVTMGLVLVFSNWNAAGAGGIMELVQRYRWIAAGIAAAVLGTVTVLKMGVSPWRMLLTAVVVLTAAVLFPDVPTLAFGLGAVGFAASLATGGPEAVEWLRESRWFMVRIMPLLFAGVAVAGFMLGRPGSEGMIPADVVHGLVGGNGLAANVFASIAGAFMYFATLTEVPILQGLTGAGMGKGPALALLLAGPALSIPNMLVIRSVMGTKKTMTYVLLVVVMASVSGMLYGALF